MHTKKNTKRVLIITAAIGACAAALWLVPVIYQADGTVAVANEQTVEPVSQVDCSSAVWPNIPAACLKDDAGNNDMRVITIPDMRQG